MTEKMLTSPSRTPSSPTPPPPLLPPPPPTLRIGSIGQNSTFSEQQHKPTKTFEPGQETSSNVAFWHE